MEDFIKAMNEYNNAISPEDAESALKECRESFKELVWEYAPKQSHGEPQ